MADSSAVAAAHHEANTQTVVDAAAATKPTPSALNPLLARGKLKKGGKGSSAKGKSKAKLVKDVAKARQDELNVVTSGGPDPAEEGEVLDLADQLLEQLGGHLEDNDAQAQPAPLQEASTSQTPASNNALSPTPSHGSGQSTRERFQGFKEDLKDAFMPNRNSDGNGERKVNRQQARKVRSTTALPHPPTLSSHADGLAPRNAHSFARRTILSSSDGKQTPRWWRRTTVRSRWRRRPSRPSAASSRS